MADLSPNMLIGGVKVPDMLAAPDPPPIMFKEPPAEAAFAALKMALADAVEAERFLADPRSHDPAYDDLAGDAGFAIDRAMGAARTAGEAPVLTPVDRTFVGAARLICCGLRVATSAEQRFVLECLADLDAVSWRLATGRTLWVMRAMITTATEHLAALYTLQDDPHPDIEPGDDPVRCEP